MKRLIAVFVVMFMAACSGLANADLFNGHGEYETDSYGYYYIVTGGKFPTGTIPNGDSASGGTFRFVTDDPVWGYGIKTWRKDDWFSDNAGFALTLKNAGGIVYDNAGIEDNSYGDYYNAHGSHGTHGLYRGYSMSNNWDWIYAGYFKLTDTTTFDRVIGYFDGNGGAADPVAFNPNSAYINYRMNIWSNVAGDLLPTNTGGFTGDVFSSDNSLGTFSPTFAINRILPDDSLDPIWRLTYTLDNPVTLQAGEYWFSHDAVVVPVPGPSCWVFSAWVRLA